MSMIFQDFKVKHNLTIKNRVSMAGIYTGYHGHSRDFTGFYTKRIEGGAGMIIVPQSTGDPLGSWNNSEFYLGFKDLLDCSELYNSKVILQIYETIEDINTVTRDTLKALPEKFARAAKAIKYSGFHGLEIHGAHYTPFMSLLSPIQNRRGDEFGGNLENRSRIIVKTVQAVRKAVGDFPLFYRVSGSEFASGGLKIEEAIQFVKMLEEAGIDCIDVSAGSGESKGRFTVSPKADTPKGCYLELAKQIKKEVSIPVISVGRVDRLEEIEEALKSGAGDIVSIGRPLICDPDFLNKIKEGVEPKKCLYCNKGCLDDSLLKGKPINCFVNPRY